MALDAGRCTALRAYRAHLLLPLLTPHFSHHRALFLSIFSRVSTERQRRCHHRCLCSLFFFLFSLPPIMPPCHRPIHAAASFLLFSTNDLPRPFFGVNPRPPRLCCRAPPLASPPPPPLCLSLSPLSQPSIAVTSLPFLHHRLPSLFPFFLLSTVHPLSSSPPASPHRLHHRSAASIAAATSPTTAASISLPLSSVLCCCRCHNPLPLPCFARLLSSPTTLSEPGVDPSPFPNRAVHRRCYCRLALHPCQRHGKPPLPFCFGPAGWEKTGGRRWINGMWAESQWAGLG